MKLSHGLHLAYCTNIHRGETWPEIFHALQTSTLAVRERVCPGKPYAIGLRLSALAAQELSAPAALSRFKTWLNQNNCYVFTINGFPYGAFHGTRVKDQVYRPDWTSDARVTYTNLLFDILAQLLPPDIEGSISTVPCGFKEIVTTPEEMRIIRANIWRCVEHAARVSIQSGHKLHLALEPEPLCLLETTREVVQFFEKIRADHPTDARLAEHLGVNYDTCHLAVEFEEAQSAIRNLVQHGIKISKLHLSSALRLRPTKPARQALSAFADDIYLHQVLVRRPDGKRIAYRDLGDALASEPVSEAGSASEPESEWRIHFHVPLYSPPTHLFDTTADHLIGVLDQLQANPALCTHLEMETYTWEVLPEELKRRDVVDQLEAEYQWTLQRLAERGFNQLA
jgi:hypothetical protein